MRHLYIMGGMLGAGFAVTAAGELTASLPSHWRVVFMLVAGAAGAAGGAALMARLTR